MEQPLDHVQAQFLADALLHLEHSIPQLLSGSPTSLAVVAGEFGEASQPSLVPERRDGDGGPEPCPVLTNAPPFLLVTPSRGGDLKSGVGLACGDVLPRIEHREVEADDVRGSSP